MTYGRHPIQCIVPPHILREVVQRGSQRQRDWAWRTLTTSEQIRGQRQALNIIAALGVTPAGQKRRAVYDAGQGGDLPGSLVREEGDEPTGDPAADEAFDGAGATYDLYDQVFGRNSIDDRGLRLNSTVHYLEGYDNAFWNGSQMVYGDGDEDLPEAERLWNRFTIAVDVIGHELTHGVTQYEANLVYRFQAGALNESFSDVFGTLVKQRMLGQTTDQADWLIGAGLFTSNVNGVAIRSMQEPGTAYDDPVLGKDPQPGHMRDYQDLALWNDNGGVHINSGIPNHAFYSVATEIGGYAWEKAGQIWYITLRDRLRRNADFQDAANLTYQVAGDLYGDRSTEQEAVRNGWANVGITVAAKGRKK
jgi:Zn-dependent metalloprotease